MSDPLARADSVLALCERVIDYEFRDPTYLRAALTHASGAAHRLASNERLEFLGDAILGAIVCERLFSRFPEYLEGDLTRIKSVVVSRRTCTKISQQLGFEMFLVLGKGMGSQDQTPASVLADVFESVVGAIYMDGGMDAARRFVIRYIDAEIDATVEGQGGINYKSHLQQMAQRQFGATPIYQLLDEKGPDHLKCFKIAARVGPQRFAPAWGPSKKDAEQRAALNALSEIGGDPAPFQDD